MMRQSSIFLFFVGMCVGCLAEIAPLNRQRFHFTLVSPKKKTMVMNGPVTFRWQRLGDSGFLRSRIQRYEVVFLSSRGGFRKTVTVFPEDSEEKEVTLKFEDCRKIFRMHGTYYWQVAAFDVEGNQTISEKWNFKVGIPRSQEDLNPLAYPYAVQFQYCHRFHSPEYGDFLKNLYSTKPIQSFSDVALVFRQNDFLVPSMEFQERFFILSQIGLGCEVSTRYRVLRNLYFALYPRVCVESHWFSTGLEDYSSTLYSVSLGFDWVIMPKGYVSFRSSWVPVYRIRYFDKEGGLRTFLGKGWEFGVRLIIPDHIVNTFRILGIEFDFRRIPLTFYFGHIRDQYSNTLMKIRRFSIEYCL